MKYSVIIWLHLSKRVWALSLLASSCFLWFKFTMATVEETVKVAVVTDRTPNIIPVRSSTLTAEELCIILCKKYKIPPLTRTLFALRVRGREYFLKDNAKVLSSTRDYELRIRFKVSTFLLCIFWYRFLTKDGLRYKTKTI